MKIRNFVIENIKGIKKLVLDDIGDVAVIAGPNGCGKSCIFDALRLFKTSYGTYSTQEISQLYNEFGIKKQELGGHRNLFRDTSKTIIVECYLELSETEKCNIERVLEETVKMDVFTSLRPKASPDEMLSFTLPPNLFQTFSARVSSTVEGIKAKLYDKFQYGKIEISTDGIPKVTENPVISFIFSHFLPNEIGSIIHLSANRHYQKTNTSHITISSINNTENRNNTLYDTNSLINKFHNDLASNYIFDLIKRNLGISTINESYLNESIKELFEKFIPNKYFKGPMLDDKGNLRFMVSTSDGFEHDVNDLSSGEKEILMGYVQIFGNSPRDSILMFDEPELHLNPRLIKSLPEFYRKHLGEHFNNQIWLVTHSDTLLTESSKSDAYSVFHITPAETSADQQAHRIFSKNQADKALLELVGDLSQYKPDRKIIIVEGENSEFDKNMISKLFPDFSNRVNLISAGSKNRVSSLQNLMEHVFRETGYSNKVFGIVDMDYVDNKKENENIYQWDRYHIENYLLEPEIISRITKSRLEAQMQMSPEQIESALKVIAKNMINHLAKQKIQKYLNDMVINVININCDKNSATIPHDLEKSLASSTDRIVKITESVVSNHDISQKFEDECKILEKSFDDNSWIKRFPGRYILKEFRKKHASWIDYEGLRDLIIDKIQLDGLRPDGMQQILNKIEKIKIE